MFRLLNIELHKLIHHRASKVLILIYFGLLTSVALVSTINFSLGSSEFNLAEMGVFNFPYIWHLNTYLSAIIKFFLLLVIISMVVNEYSYKTLKQNLIDGLTKKEFILSKFYAIITLAALSTVFVFLVSLILGLIYSDFKSPSIIFSDLDYLLAFFVKLVGFFSFGFFFGMLIKRSAFAIGAMFIWTFIENVIIKGILYWNFKYLGEKTTSKVDSIMQFFPLESLSNLIKEPFTRLSGVKTIAANMGISKNYQVIYSDILIVLIWTSIFIYSSYVILKKRDL